VIKTALRRAAALLTATLAIAAISLTGTGLAGAAVVNGTYNITNFAPTDVAAGATGTTYSFTLNNQSPPESQDILQTLTVHVATGFTGVSGQSSAGWTATSVGNTVTFQGTLLPLGTANLSIVANAPGTTGSYTWTTSATGLVGGATGTPADFTNSGSDPSVNVAGSVTVCDPLTPCDSGAVGDHTNTTADVHLDQGTGSGDVLTVTVGGTLPRPLCATSTDPKWGQTAKFDNHDSTRNMTVTYVIADRVADNGPDQPSKYGVCYQSDKPFATRSGAPAAQSGTQYYGYLPNCAAGTPVAPCIISATKLSGGDRYHDGAIQFVVASQSGDPLLGLGPV
jgi:hypothetical protein